MTECLHHRNLCDTATDTGGNTHRCFLDQDHRGAHVCVCWFRWVTT